MGATGVAGVTAGCLGDDEENGDDPNGNGGGPNGGGSATFEVNDLNPGDTTITAGGSLAVSAAVGNTGDAEGTQTLTLQIDGSEMGSQDVTLSSSAVQEVSFDVEAVDLAEGDYDYGVYSEDDEVTATLTVEPATPYFDVSGLEPGDTTAVPGTVIDVSATVENTGDAAGEQDVELSAGGTVVDSTTLSLDEDASDSVALALDTSDLAPGEYTYAVATDDDDASATLTTEFAGTVETPWGINTGNVDQEFSAVQIDDIILDDDVPDGVITHGEPSVSVRGEDARGEIEGTEYDDVYYTEHFGADIGYTIPVDGEGVYFVTFHWAETWWGEDGQSGDPGEGSRVFDVALNGETVLEEFDIYAEAGGAYSAITRTFAVQAPDGVISIESSTVEDNTMFNAIEVRRAETEVPLTGGGVGEEPAFTLHPEGHQLSNESGDPPEGPEDISAEFYFGYDEDNLYLRGEVSDDEHDAIEGEGMWEADSIQYAAGYDGTYGPEDGISHVDGETSTHRWMDGENEAGLDQVDATTSRDGEAGVTTYEATIPWEAILPEAPEPGDSFRFGVMVNESDGDGRDAVLNWTQPAINADKEYGALGTFTLEDTIVEVPYGLNVGGHPGEPQSPVPVIKDGIVFDSRPGAAVDVTAADEVPDWVDWEFELPNGISHTSKAIEGTENDALYQTEFHGPDLGFDIAVENGVYDLVLYFAEVSDTLGEGDRIFDLEVQGETVFEGLDIAAEAGKDQAMEVSVGDVEVTDNTLSISSTSHEDFTKFCGVEVRRSTTSAPFGINSGGNDLGETVEIDGLEFVNDPVANPYVTVYGNPENSGTGTEYSSYTVDGEIENTEHDALYQTEHHGGDVSYDVYIENGTYDVTLHFAETNDAFAGGGRTYDVGINGQTVLPEYEPGPDAGGAFIATSHTFTVEVTDNVLSVTTSTIADNSKWSGIEIREPGAAASEPVAHWTFDAEGVDGETVIDQTGNGHDGEILGDVATGLDAPVGAAAEFDGSAEAQTVLVPHDEALNPPAYSVSVWMQSENLDEWRALVAKEESMWCGIEGDTGENTARMDAHDGNEWNEGPWGEASLDDGQWHHLVYRHAPDEGVSEIYLDGALEASVEAGGESQPSENDLGIGANNNDRDWYTGRIADVRLYDRPLSEDEIAELHESEGDEGSENLIENASFEDATDGQPDSWEPHTWGEGSFEFSQSEDAADGEYSAMFSSEDGVDGSLFQDVDVEPNTDYVYSGQIKTDGVEGDGFGALLNVQELSAESEDAMAGPISGTTDDWQQVEWAFNSGDNDTLQFNCTLGGWGQSSGVAYFDDLSLVPADDGSGEEAAFEDVLHFDDHFEFDGGTDVDTDEYEVDLSSFAGEGAIQLRFEHAYPEEVGGWGPSVYSVDVHADGERLYLIDPPFDGSYLAEDDSQAAGSSHRFADDHGYWVYEFDVPTDADSVTATVEISNGFRVGARAVDGDGVVDTVDVPYGLNAGGVDGGYQDAYDDPVVEIDGLTFDNNPRGNTAVQILGGPGSYFNDTEIDGTEHDALYQSELHGEIDFEIAIENGTYDVVLHFAEQNDSLGEEFRIFNVDVQGERILEDFDIVAEAGGAATAYEESVTGVEVTDGVLSITSEAIEDNPAFSAIEIHDAS